MKNNQLICLILLQFISVILFGHTDNVPCYEETPLIPPQNSINKDGINKPASIQSRTCYLLEDLDTPLAINQEIRTMLTLGDEVIVGGSFLHLNDSFSIQTSGVFSYRVATTEVFMQQVILCWQVLISTILPTMTVRIG